MCDRFYEVGGVIVNSLLNLQYGGKCLSFQLREYQPTFVFTFFVYGRLK